MAAKFLILTLAVLAIASLSEGLGFKCDKLFLDEEVCGAKGDKTIDGLSDTCKTEMKHITEQRTELCEEYKKAEGEAAIDKACEFIAKKIKEMSDQEKKDIKKCFGEAYEKAHGKKFGE